MDSFIVALFDAALDVIWIMLHKWSLLSKEEALEDYSIKRAIEKKNISESWIRNTNIFRCDNCGARLITPEDNPEEEADQLGVDPDCESFFVRDSLNQ